MMAEATWTAQEDHDCRNPLGHDHGIMPGPAYNAGRCYTYRLSGFLRQKNQLRIHTHGSLHQSRIPVKREVASRGDIKPKLDDFFDQPLSCFVDRVAHVE